MPGPILVIGATGNQGRATAEHLLAAGWSVRGLTRDPQSEAAGHLAAHGVELVVGDMEDPASLLRAMEGVHGVFSVQPTIGSPGTSPDFTADDEVRWGTNVAEAAEQAQVRHFVYSSVEGAERSTGVVNSDSKWKIEQRIHELGLPATIVRPVSFMENYATSYLLRDGALMSAILPDVKQQIIAVNDVGAIVAAVFGDADQWRGRSLAIAGDSLTPVEVAHAISEALSQPLPYLNIPIETIRQISPMFATANEWLNQHGYQADIAATRQLRPELLDFDAWLQQGGADLIRAELDAQRANQ